MKYLGGKAKVLPKILPIIQRKMSEVNAKRYVEPFCGSCAVAVGLRRGGYAGEIICSDANGELIAMFQALKEGWVPPRDISKEYYEQIKHDLNAPSHVRGYVGLCSYRGKYWGGYAPPHKSYVSSAGTTFYHNYDHALYNSVHRDLLILKTLTYYPIHYETAPFGDVIYCDPPYQTGTQYKGFQFDYSIFKTWAEHPDRASKILVSDFTPVPGWDIYGSYGRKNFIQSKSSDVVEYVMQPRSCLI